MYTERREEEKRLCFSLDIVSDIFKQLILKE